ncbi:MAG TPA: hypothetical protein VGO47_10995, partial [Chlamydiales bacterium]|nr:hypothetical protein [Chlamydiales bacterium]
MDFSLRVYNSCIPGWRLVIIIIQELHNIETLLRQLPGFNEVISKEFDRPAWALEGAFTSRQERRGRVWCCGRAVAFTMNTTVIYQQL